MKDNVHFSIQITTKRCLEVTLNQDNIVVVAYFVIIRVNSIRLSFEQLCHDFMKGIYMKSQKKRGFFITLEGPDGSGKSTQFKLLSKRLKQAGCSFVQTREPGGHPLSEKIRSLLLSTKGSEPTPETELLLFLAARAQHVNDLILPALQENKIVLCERFSDSTYAYQVGGRKLSAAFYKEANQFATKRLKPDLTLLYDIKSEIGLERAFQAKMGHDRMETVSIQFSRRVRKSYLDLAKNEPNRIKIMDASQSMDAVGTAAWKIVERKLKARQLV